MSRAPAPVAFNQAGEAAQVPFRAEQRRLLADLLELGLRVVRSFADEQTLIDPPTSEGDQP